MCRSQLTSPGRHLHQQTRALAVSGRGRSVDAKHATAFTRLLGLGRHEQLAVAWGDHRQEMPETLDQASPGSLAITALIVTREAPCHQYVRW